MLVERFYMEYVADDTKTTSPEVVFVCFEEV